MAATPTADTPRRHHGNRSAPATDTVEQLLGDEAASLLEHRCETVPKSALHLPGPDFVDRIWAGTDRSNRVLRNLSALYEHGRLGGTGYVSILPVDQGIEHSAGASFAPNPEYFDPGKIVELAVEGGCNGVASTFGVLGAVSRHWAHHIPFIVKLNHNELLTYPNKFDQILFGTVNEAWNLGAVAVGATIYFGSDEADRQIQESRSRSRRRTSSGWRRSSGAICATPPSRRTGSTTHLAADLTGQANHLGVTIEADIIKQKLPTTNGGYTALNFGKTADAVYTKLTSDHPIDLCRYQVLNCYAGRVGLINSGGEFDWRR